MNRWFTHLMFLLVACAVTSVSGIEAVYPGQAWARKSADQVGLDSKKLKTFSDFTGGFGCVIRHGYLVYAWGDPSRRMDVASAAKPIYSHFLFKAIENKRISSLDDSVSRWEPRLKQINEKLSHKDARITSSSAGITRALKAVTWKTKRLAN